MRSLQPFLVDLKSLQSELKQRFKVEEEIDEDEEDGTEEEAMVTAT